MSIALLGDSTLDNGSYSIPSVVGHCRAIDPEGTYHLLAENGAHLRDIRGQLRRLPIETEHIILSIGGNDLMSYQGDLFRIRAGEKMLQYLYRRSLTFEMEYEAMLEEVLAEGLPLTVCLVYDKMLEEYLKAALALFDGKIYTLATEHLVPIIDLRKVCTETEDFVYSIEPSVQGGEKIAHWIVRATKPIEEKPKLIKGPEEELK